ncbi:MAG: hypothetical protein ACRDRH_28235 [Pseudonocardia sp.]
MTEGALLVDGAFELGRALLTEFSRYRPGEVFGSSDVPALIVHGWAGTGVVVFPHRDDLGPDGFRRMTGPLVTGSPTVFRLAGGSG